ncbi:MAG: hypothetical protein ACRCW2_08125 [Cellulosilyticaceae bacterium]
MNWDKTVNILIALFVVVNSCLAGANYQKNVNNYRLSQRRVENVVKVFEEDQNLIACELPRNFRPMGTLWTEPVEIEGASRDALVDKVFGSQRDQVVITQIESPLPYGKMQRVYRTGDRSLTFGGNTIFYKDESIRLGTANISKSDGEKLARAFLRQIGLDKKYKNVKSEYRSESYGALITYYEVYEGIPLFDSFVVLQVTPYGVAGFYGQSVNVVKSSSEPRPLYPIDKVLYGLQDETFFEGPVTIENITLGYGMENSEGMHILKEEAIPMYKITCKGLDEPLFVNAYTNMIENRGVNYFYK